jgi:NTE family protein
MTPLGPLPTRTGTTVKCALLLLAMVPCLIGCTTVFDNQPLNRPMPEVFVPQPEGARDLVSENVIALSLSGGGLRAAAFALGVLQALDDPAGEGGSPDKTDWPTDLYDDITFISSVSGGSLTAAYVALKGRDGLSTMRESVLLRDLERDLRVTLWSPTNLSRLLAGGLNDRSNLARTLDKEVFAGATFADLQRRRKPEVWINATDLYNRTPFPFSPQAFQSLCSDLASLLVSEAVAASMAVPLLFAPVILKTYPDHCRTPLNPLSAQLLKDPARVATDPVGAVARAMSNYRDPSRMRYVKLADGGLTDNQGLASILIARSLGGTPYAPFSEADAVRIQRMLFLIVDAGRPPLGDWAMTLDGPSGVSVGLAAADAAIDSATRLSADAFRTMVREWRDAVVRHRCGLTEAQVRRFVADRKDWRCDDVQFIVGTISAESLDPARARRLREMPTRLSLPASDVDAAIDAGRAATRGNTALHEYLGARAAARGEGAGAKVPR